MTVAQRARTVVRRLGIEVARGGGGGSLLAGHLDALFKRHEIDCVFDVGARVGEFAGLLRCNGYEGEIHSFEPVSTNYAQLEQRAAGDPAWHTHDVALGAAEGAAQINVTAATQFSSFLTPNSFGVAEFGAGMAVPSTETVEVHRLDDWVARSGVGVGRRTYLKMDTQGWDLEVLAGARAELRRTIVALQSEVSIQAIYDDMPPWQKSIDTITGYGFALSGLFPVNLTPDLEVIELDCVAVRTRRD